MKLKQFINLEIKQLISEGKYDSLTRKMVKLIFDHIKSSKKTTKYEYEDYIENKNISFDFVLKIMRKNIDNYIINAYTDNELEDDAEIEIILQINPNNEEKLYKEIYMELNDTVRHEIEHLLQSGYNKIPNKPKKTTLKKYNSFVTKPYKEYLLKDEIPAYVVGFYRRAKLEKKAVDVIMFEFLNWYVENDIMTKIEMKKVLNTWIKHSKKNYPKAIYKLNIKQI